MKPVRLEGMLSWDEMCQRVNAGRIIELKNKRGGTLQRAKLVSMRTSVDKNFIGELVIKWVELYTLIRREWVGSGYSDFDIGITRNTPLPLSFADGRIIFSTADIDFTIYPAHAPIDCP